MMFIMKTGKQTRIHTHISISRNPEHLMSVIVINAKCRKEKGEGVGVLRRRVEKLKKENKRNPPPVSSLLNKALAET